MLCCVFVFILISLFICEIKNEINLYRLCAPGFQCFGSLFLQVLLNSQSNSLTLYFTSTYSARLYSVSVVFHYNWVPPPQSAWGCYSNACESHSNNLHATQTQHNGPHWATVALVVEWIVYQSVNQSPTLSSQLRGAIRVPVHLL